MKLIRKIIMLTALICLAGCTAPTTDQELSDKQESMPEIDAIPTDIQQEEAAEIDLVPNCSVGESGQNLPAIITMLEEDGGRLALSPDNQTIAYDKKGEDGYFDLWTMSIDGTDNMCLTCDHTQLPTRNVGQPDWHASGKYILVQVEKQEHHEGLASGLAANPGAGIYNDLWILDIETMNAWLVHEVPNGKGHGVLHPHFSKDGRMLSWAQSYKDVVLNDPARIGGSWELRVADVEIDSEGVLYLSNQRIIQPGDDVWYENHGFSPDGQKLIFTSNFTAEEPFSSADIYTVDLGTDEIIQLTNEGYNEHGQFSPDGSKVVWMTTNENIAPDEVVEVTSTDWWIMNADGSEKERLTYFNQEDHPHFVVWGTVAADFAWLPRGDGFIGYYHTFGLENVLRGEFREAIVRVDFCK